MSIIKAKYYPYGSKIKGTKITRNCAIEDFPAPEMLYLCTSQHIGAPATPVVSVSDAVKKGQLIASASGAVSANVFSPVSGVVSEIKDIVNGLGQKQTYIVIKNDMKNDQVFFDNLPDTEPNTLIERIRLAGIVGLGGAGFPTAVKLTPKTPVDTLVINGAECEPYLTCDFRLMIERTEDVYKGIKYLAKALNVSNIVMGIEINKPEAIELFSKYDDVKVVPLRKQYPMGSEKHLIYVTTGRKVPVGKMPFDVKCCVQNIKTAIACFEAVELNKPLTESVITVSGKALKNHKNLKVPFGTPYEDIIAYCGGVTPETIKIISGGPMMGKALFNLNQYTKKTDSGILLLKEGETNSDQPSNCINCGTCAKKCPMRLTPMYIESFALAGDFKGAEKYGAMNCIECGLCAYNCPARRSLVQSIQYAKQKIKESKQNGK